MLPHDVQERVNILVQDRNPIAATALVRAETGAGIVECSAYVDDLVQKATGCRRIAREGYQPPGDELVKVSAVAPRNDVLSHASACLSRAFAT